MRHRYANTAALTAAFGLAFALWSWLTFSTTDLAALDATSTSPGVDLAGGWGQLTAALSFALHPFASYAAVVILAVWAARRRLRNLALALAIAAPLGWGSERLLKLAFGRERPANRVPLVTSEGLAYPSGHMVGISVLIVLVLAVWVVTRRAGPAVWAGRAGLVGLWLLVAYNRWALRAHYMTDIVAGGLWGGFVASVSLLVAGVHVVAPWAGPRARSGVPPRVALIVNPTKIPDWEVMRKHVDGAARAHGWGRPLWLETTADEPGVQLARVAIERQADLVLVAGGDGTVRAVCEGLAGSGVALAVLPAGTGNLLARNLGVPLDMADALDVAFDGVPAPLDLVRVRADGGEEQASVVMTGMGVDAMIMSETNPDLKRAVGPAAYVVAAVNAMNRPVFEVAVTVGEREPVRRQVGLALVANVGQLFGGIQLMPDARAGDGLVDLLLAEASGPAAWAGMAGQVMSRPGATVRGIERAQARRVLLEAEQPVPYQVDGDTAGECLLLEARVDQGALTVMVPR